jgi:long-chain fatty acid transport protein
MLLLVCASVGGSGLQSPEQNASGLGVSYAGSAAIAENASTVFHNPAGLVLLPRSQVSLGASGVLQKYAFHERASLGLSGGNGGEAGVWRVHPNAYLAWKASPEWSVGLGISSPFGLRLDYDDDWIGRPFGVGARLRTINVNPSVAYRFSDVVSLGGGLDYQKLRLTVDQPGTQRTDSDAAWGWNAGVLLTLSPAMRVGIAYRSAIKYDLGDVPAQEARLFPGLDANGHLKTPGTLTLSVWQRVSERWEAMGDLSYTRWKALDDFEHDGWRFAWGAAYTYNSQWKSRFGLAYEHGPLRGSQRAALLPDHHRIWLSLGGQYRLGENAALDFGYAYQWVKDSKIDQIGAGVRLKGRYDASGHVIGVQYTQGF